jgi:hypothetical protein
LPTKTFLRHIKHLADEGKLEQAVYASMYGKEFSPEEIIIFDYYNSHEQLEDAMKGLTNIFPFSRQPFKHQFSKAELKQIEEKRLETRGALCQLFLMAVDTHNHKMIKAMADAVWFFKDKRLKGFAIQDRERTVLIILKIIMDMTKMKFTMRQIQSLLKHDDIQRGERLEKWGDGFASTRRKCRELGIPVAKSKDKMGSDAMISVLLKWLKQV